MAGNRHHLPSADDPTEAGAMPSTAQLDVLVITRGHHHDLPAGTPAADFELDLRRTLSDPAHRPEGDMLDLTGRDPEVRAFVLATRGAKRLVRDTVRLVRGTARVRPVVVWVGCAGGKHRAAAIGEELATRLSRRGLRFWARPLRVEVRHLHVDLPRIIGADERAACPPMDLTSTSASRNSLEDEMEEEQYFETEGQLSSNLTETYGEEAEEILPELLQRIQGKLTEIPAQDIVDLAYDIYQGL